MRRAKIVCTIGPATSGDSAIEALIRSGMDVARFNFSHGDHESHEKAIRTVRKKSQELGRYVAVLQDLQGIKIRVGRFRDGSIRLHTGQSVRIVTGDGAGDDRTIYIDYPWLITDAKKEDLILLDDGAMSLRVTGKNGDVLTATVLEGGVLQERKGVNFPQMKITAPFLTDKDKTDLAFGMRCGVDFVGLSFVRTIEDILSVKQWLSRRRFAAQLIAKIEKGEAVENIDSILDVVEGIMVARGDLGVEIPLEEVPVFQKQLITKANGAGKLVITATQMLESMTSHTRPTRAETSDVANAVLDGTDALMLSAETSIGKYPSEAVRVMDRIIGFTEMNAKTRPSKNPGKESENMYDFPEAIARSAANAAEQINARCIAVFTRSGFTARLVSKFRPGVPIIAFSPHQEVLQRMSLYWGISPYPMKHVSSIDEMIREADSLLLHLKHVKKRDRIVIVARHPVVSAGKTNFMKTHVVGENS
ncbi:MAG TPA: pyruvate kinase [Syntrophorhabdaceae bacterium]|nr:pyruvate kinase [Syntrophorhabdaceae bacterium]